MGEARKCQKGNEKAIDILRVYESRWMRNHDFTSGKYTEYLQAERKLKGSFILLSSSENNV